MSRRDLPEWRHDKPPSASKLNRLTGEVGRLTGLPTSGESYVDNTSGRYPIPRRRSGAKRLSHYRIIAKNCIVDGASLYVGDVAEVFPAEFNGGSTGVENNYVIARPCTERGEIISDDPEPETGYTADTVLICLSAAFRGFVARDIVVTGIPNGAPPSAIDVGIERSVLAVTGGVIDIVGTAVSTALPGDPVATEIVLYADNPPDFDGTDTEVQVAFYPVASDATSILDGNIAAVTWEIVAGATPITGTPIQSRLRLTDYWCQVVEEEEP